MYLKSLKISLRYINHEHIYKSAANIGDELHCVNLQMDRLTKLRSGRSGFDFL